MNPRERMLEVYGHKKPDRIPVAPCFAYLVPAKRTGKKFYDITAEELWRSRLSLFDYYGCGGRFAFWPRWRRDHFKSTDRAAITKDGRKIIETTIETEKGILTSKKIQDPFAAPALSEYPVKKIEDYEILLDTIIHKVEDAYFPDLKRKFEEADNKAIFIFNIPQFLPFLFGSREGGIVQEIGRASCRERV